MNLTNIFKALYTCILIIPLMPLCVFPVRDYLKRRIPSLFLVSFVRFVGFTLFSILISYVITLPTKFVISLCAGLYFLCFYCREVELPINKALFIFLTTFMVSSFSRIFGTMIDIALHPENTYYDISIEGFIFQMLFLLLMDLILYIPFSKYLGWLIANFHFNSVWNYVCLFPALCILVTYILIPHNYNWMYIGRALQMYLAVIFCLIILIIILYTLFYQFVFTYIEKQKLEHSNEILSIQGAQYQQLLSSVQENSRIRHDFRHQLVVISELLGQKEYSKLEDYVDSYIQSASKNITIYSDSPALNAILSYYDALCADKRIRTDFILKMPPALPVSDQDLCVMLGNLLENAVYGCEHTSDPYIQLKLVQTASNVLAVKIRNPYIGPLNHVDGTYLSSRHDGFGQGLESVRIIAEKYHGCMEVQNEQQIFTVKILLQLL